MPVPLPVPLPGSSAATLAIEDRQPTIGLDHHRLDVYRQALRSLDSCDEVLGQLPAGRSRLRDQIDRAASSVVANIAEGAGEFSPREKARFYRMARRSAIEVVAWIEIIERRGEASEQSTAKACRDLERVVSMLVRLIQSCDR